MISVCDSNTLTIFSCDLVTPAKIRSLVCFTTCCTRCIIVASDFTKLRRGMRRRRGPSFTSSNIRCAWFTVFRVKLSSSPYCFFLRASPSAPRYRVDRAIARTRFRTLRMRSRTLRLLHDPLVQLLNHFRSDELPQPRQGLRIGHLLVSDPRKSPIHQIGTHFSLQRVIAPVSNVFQQQQTQYHFGRRLLTPPPAALRISFALRLINRIQQLLIFQQTIDQTHPRFPQVLDILCQTWVPQRLLLVS